MLPFLLAAAAAASFSGAAREQACAGKLGWTDPAPPAHVFGNVYDVGTCGITALLIVGDKGDILIDTGPVEAAPLVERSIQQLGFRLHDVKLILATHEHLDHVGGLGPVLEATGAEAWLSPRTARAIKTGAVDPEDPQLGSIDAPRSAPVSRELRDGEIVRLGSLRLLVHSTPGHSPGGMSYTWRSCEAGRCLDFAYADSLTAISREGYRFSDHPERVAALQRSFQVVAGLPCDVLLTPHPDASDMPNRLAGKAPLVNRSACTAYSARARRGLDQRLAKEAAGPTTNARPARRPSPL